MPELNRALPLHLQIADHYARLIAAGEYRPGDQLPSARDISAEWGVSNATAWRALQHLDSSKLATTTPKGTYVAGQRIVLGPQQRLTATRLPESERVEVRAAAYIDAPAYVVPILGIEPLPGELHPVIRREQVTYDKDGTPFMLSVSWFPGRFAELVPELDSKTPITEPGGAARLIEQRTGRTITHGKQSREARLIKDDGREGPLLNLQPGTAVLAETYLWFDDTDVLEYGEYVLIMNRVTENDFSV